MEESGVLDKTSLVFGQMNEPPGACARVALSALAMAEYFRDEENRDLLLLSTTSSALLKLVLKCLRFSDVFRLLWDTNQLLRQKWEIFKNVLLQRQRFYYFCTSGLRAS